MTETNYLELIKNKLDSLVDKIVQKENSDENFRITYAQILEKINTKMDVFSSGEDFETLCSLSQEVKTILFERREIVDSKFNAIKAEFDNINQVLINSLKTPELLAAFNKIENQIHYFAEEQENQKCTFNSIISHIEKFGTLEETNEKIESEFNIIKGQNTSINESLNKQIAILDEINKVEQENSQKACEALNNIIFDLKEFSESADKYATVENAEEIKELINEKTDSVINQIHETDSIIDKVNKTLSDLLNSFEKFNITEALDQKIEAVKEDLTDIISEESVATSKQINEISFGLENLGHDLSDVISEERAIASSQINEISTSIETLRNDLSCIISTEKDEQSAEIAESLKNLQTKFVSHLVQIADNISFAEETDEINENIFNCTDEIKEKISSDISEIKDDIALLKDESNEDNDNIISLLEKIDNAVKTDINNDLKTLISGFKLITSGLSEDKDYIYTLPDIESDLSKIRLDLNNIQNSIVSTESLSEENTNDITAKINNIKSAIEKLEDNPINTEIKEVKNLFDTLNEDISSISKRTNKLILTSDEVNKTLRNNIDSFSSLLRGFENQSQEFYNSVFMNELNLKIETIKRTTSSLQQSDKVLNEAFMYLAEWIDTTSDSFDEIKTDIAKVKRNLLSDDENISEKLARSIKALSTKVDEQDTKFEAVDEKLNRILAQQNDTKELKSLVEYVASQVSVTNEKIIENEKLSQRISSMEKQLKKIEKNVSRITDYLDEDDDSSDETEV